MMLVRSGESGSSSQRVLSTGALPSLPYTTPGTSTQRPQAHRRQCPHSAEGCAHLCLLAFCRARVVRGGCSAGCFALRSAVHNCRGRPGACAILINSSKTGRLGLLQAKAVAVCTRGYRRPRMLLLRRQKLRAAGDRSLPSVGSARSFNNCLSRDWLLVTLGVPALVPTYCGFNAKVISVRMGPSIVTESRMFLPREAIRAGSCLSFCHPLSASTHAGYTNNLQTHKQSVFRCTNEEG
jgi:hypothetical protein